MKHLRFFLLILILGLATLAQSQAYIGFQSGYTKASEDYGDRILPEDALTHIHGFMAGVVVRKDFGRVYIDLEPQYRRRGAACYPNFTFFRGDTEFQLN